MSNLENLLTRLTIDITQKQEHYVYYDKETNRIHKISPINQESKFEFFSIDSKIVEPILKGLCKLDDYIVYFDYKLKKFSIKKKQNELYSDVSIIEIEKSENPDLDIQVDKTYITFNFHETLQESVKADQSSLIFVFTEQHNPYKLYFSFNIQTKELLANNKIQHQLTKSQLKNGVSMYTNSVFETYNLTINL